MRHPRGSAAALFCLLSLVLLLAGCPKRPATSGMSAPAPSATRPAAPPAAAAPAAPAPPPAPSAAAPRPSEFAANENLKDIHFDFDRSDIRSGDARILDANAAWLKTHRDQALLIEGHCDERGTNEYNLALGERRAKAAMTYLSGQGVQAGRMTLVSYGKERPTCTEHNEACWAQNRRAHFLVKAQ